MRRKLVGSDDTRTEEMRERLEELGYTNGGVVYEFFTPRTDLDSILDDIEDETGLRFKEGDDGHAQLAGNTLEITSKREILDSRLGEIENVCQMG